MIIQDKTHLFKPCRILNSEFSYTYHIFCNTAVCTVDFQKSGFLIIGITRFILTICCQFDRKDCIFSIFQCHRKINCASLYSCKHCLAFDFCVFIATWILIIIFQFFHRILPDTVFFYLQFSRKCHHSLPVLRIRYHTGIP